MKRRVTTQIGSLPFKNTEEALTYSLGCDIPFLPELINLGDGMLKYIDNPGELSCLKEFQKHRFDVVKIQCVGPATLILSGYEENSAIEQIATHVQAILDDLKANETILFLDEPALGHAGFDYEELWSAIFSSFNVTPGVHVCGAMDWDRLFLSKNIEIISVDVSEFDITKYPLYRSGKRIAWGIKEEKDIKEFQRGDFLTPPCGLGMRSVKECEEIKRNIDRIAQKLG